MQDDLRHVGIGFDVVVIGWFAPQARSGREGRAGARLAAFAFDRGDQRGFFTADERAGALADFQVEGEIGAENVLAQEAEFARLLDGNVQVLHRDRVFRAAVDVAACSRRWRTRR